LIQDKLLNGRLRDILRRAKESNQNPFLFILKSLLKCDFKNLYGRTCKDLNKAGELINEQSELNQKQNNIGKA
jgi:hypothetical protein